MAEADAKETAPPSKRLENPVETDSPPAEPPRGWAPPQGGRLWTYSFILVAIAGALAVLWSWHLWPFTTYIETTDDAYVRGQTTVIAPQVSGYVTNVYVQDFEQVRAGTPLVKIDDLIYRQRVDQAAAQVATQQATLANSQQSERSSQASVGGQVASLLNARAQLARAEADERRVDELVAQGSVSLRERDQTHAALAQAQAGVRQAEAQQRIAEEQVRTVRVGRGGLAANVQASQAALELARIDLSHTIVTAPQTGQVSEVGVRVGQYVTAGTQLMFLVPQSIWVVANYKEAQTARMAPGQPARVRVDALGGIRLKGHVERLSPAAGNEFSVIRPDNATGNFVKVAQRIAVRIAIDPGQPEAARLRPGISVEARIDTRGTRR